MPRLNLITDVAGLRVGNAHDPALASGVTAILVDRPNVASVHVGGGAPGSRDTTLLEPEMTVEGVDAVVLAGGSAFGLDAAGGVMGHLRDRGRGLAVGSAVVPIVVQAIVFDLLNGGDKGWRRQPPYWDLGWLAAECAATGRFDLGTAGGGYGATTATLKGGLGSASIVTPSGFSVAALAVVNAVGSATIGNEPNFWAAPYEIDAEFGGLGMPPHSSASSLPLRMKGGLPPPSSTTIALVATDAILTKAQAKRLAIMADDGLARSLRPSHASMDGDTVFAVATQRRPLTLEPVQLTEIGQAAADCLARSVARGVFEATALPFPGSPGDWRSQFGGRRP